MKNIVIHTACSDYIFTNSGSFLQHWALRNVLKELGYNPCRDCHGDNRIFSTKTKIYFDYILASFRLLLHYSKCKKYADATFNFKSLRKYYNIIKFRKDYIKYIGDISEEITSDVDAVLLGGDQILYPSDLNRILSITAKKHIIFTASADWVRAQNSNEWKSLCKSALKNIDAIGVREKVGVTLINTLGFQAVHVADPVMQLPVQKFINIAYKGIIFQKPTLFCYILNAKSKEDLGIYSFNSLARYFSVELKISGIQGSEYYIPYKNYISLCPSEFIKALIDAKYVITNSYHGTVLAIMLHKPFISLIQKETKDSDQNTRQQELLSWLGLEHHRITLEEINEKAVNLLNDNIDWKIIDKEITSFNTFSRNWIKELLK